MIIGIIGSRSRNRPIDFEQVNNKFFEIYEDGDWICSGGCPQGGDKFAEVIAKDNGIPMLIFWADPEKTPKSYFDRNTDIAGHSDVLIACITDDDSKCKGTMDTVRKFKKRKTTGQVYLIKEDNTIEIMGEPEDPWK
ncbi:MAG: hypothetical protein KAS32_09100 [Candidatus Peribacteraceae bacterium]|nr:hypothetical protein [Candidatus Peribacteraceae bacterium]